MCTKKFSFVEANVNRVRIKKVFSNNLQKVYIIDHRRIHRERKKLKFSNFPNNKGTAKLIRFSSIFFLHIEKSQDWKQSFSRLVYTEKRFEFKSRQKLFPSHSLNFSDMKINFQPKTSPPSPKLMFLFIPPNTLYAG